MKLLCSAITVSPDITLYHTGPALDHGPLPTLFYFAISGPDSLILDPYNQPVQFLQGEMVRIFSMTLPAHEGNLAPSDAMGIWAEDFKKKNFLVPFLESVQTAIDFAIRERFIDPKHMAVGGLSRGAFIAAHVAARDPRFRFFLGFAPLTHLKKIQEFQNFPNVPWMEALDLIYLADLLADRHIRLYIGNHDTRVGTQECFDFAMALVKKKKQPISQVELIMTPSIGKMGHGTSPEIFKQGAQWILRSVKQ